MNSKKTRLFLTQPLQIRLHLCSLTPSVKLGPDTHFDANHSKMLLVLMTKHIFHPHSPRKHCCHGFPREFHFVFKLQP